MVKIKICGITNLEDAVKAFEFKADLLGFIFIEGTPRCISPDDARDVLLNPAEKLYTKIGSVGLFLNEDIEKMVEIISYCGLGHAQLQGDESPGDCSELKRRIHKLEGPEDFKVIKVFKVGEDLIKGVYSPSDYKDVDYFVFDTYDPKEAGGTGEKFNWNALKNLSINKPFFIAGGLNPDNVSEAIKTAKEIDNFYGVDTSSGVEKEKGKKDENLLKEFIQNAKNA